MVAASGLLFIVGLIVGGVFYFLPAIIALVRSAPNVGAVIVINIFLGWTFVGWVVALAMACASTARGVPHGQAVYVYPQPAPPPQWAPPQQYAPPLQYAQPPAPRALPSASPLPPTAYGAPQWLDPQRNDAQPHDRWA